jgi:hypothetical protein
MLGVVRRMPASTNGRMFIRTPSFRSGFQPKGYSVSGFQRTTRSAAHSPDRSHPPPKAIGWP